MTPGALRGVKPRPVYPLADLARRIPGACHEEIPGLGHDLPEAPWPRFVAGWRRLAG